MLTNTIKFKVNDKFENMYSVTLIKEKIISCTYVSYIIYYKLHLQIWRKNTPIEIWVKNINSLFAKEEIKMTVQ